MTLITAAIARTLTASLTSPRLRDARRRMHALRRAVSGGQPTLHYFHDPADPYSHLAAQMLPALARRYAVELRPHLVPPPDRAAAPDALRLAAWSRSDAAILARDYGLDFPAEAAAPDEAALRHFTAMLAATLHAGDFAAAASAGGAALWRGVSLPNAPEASAGAVATLLAEGAATRARLGHYLGATFYFEGEWFWGIDRLHHLEARLVAEGRERQHDAARLAPVRDVTLGGPPLQGAAQELHMFLSFRSPYSYIALPRAMALARHYNAPLRLRFVLPMVMRGLPVPGPKRFYIMLDTKREAERLGLPFGKIVDPVGPGVERGLAVLHHAIAAGRGAEFALSFLQGAFADGIDATTQAGLERMATRAGLAAPLVQTALADPSWRNIAEANRAELLAEGLWGVPCFRAGNGRTVWGQDRLWVVERELRGEV